MHYEQEYLILDYESRSEAELKKTGGYEYANHDSTKFLCASWRIGTRAQLREQLLNKMKFEKENSGKANPFAAKVWSPAFKDTGSTVELFNAFADSNIQLVAHNAIFEQVMTRFVFPKYLRYAHTVAEIPHDRWYCTASLAASLALPRNLEGACLALGLPIKKDMDGRRLMLKLSKPRKASKNNQSQWHNSARDLRRVMTYCQNDVDAETMLFLTLPPLNPTERKVWLLDQKINFRGFEADRVMVKKTLSMIAKETEFLNAETTRITHGRPGSTTQRNGVLKWLHEQGVFLPDLRAKTVIDALDAGLAEGDAKRILQIRQAISKTSTAKYAAFETRSRTDGRVRDILVYHTASTGRWGGAGVQPQNFPRGMDGIDTVYAADVLRTGDLELVRLLYGNPMGVFSSCLRSVITASAGNRILCADYAAIEARVLFWIAGHTAGVKGFFENLPMYEEMAAEIYSVDRDDVTKPQRQVGKQAFLGCGYGMGWKKFIQTCKAFGMDVDEEIAQIAVKSYRNLHSPVVKLWSNIERAAIAATLRKGKKFTINKTSWWVGKLPGTNHEFLWCQLPSGRRLAYHGPKVKYENTPWGDKRPVLYHNGVNPRTRKWEAAGTYGGRLTENVVQAVARDLMAEAMLRIEDAGYDLILTVHDELVAEAALNWGSLKQFENLMAEVPKWAEGCPVRVEGWEGPRYRK